MKVVKIRRVGNSNVVSLPHELESRGYTAGTDVVVDDQPTGELHITLVPAVREVVRRAAAEAAAENHQALEILADHDRQG